MSVPIEKLDSLGPDEEIGVFDGSGQWIDLLTVRDFRKYLRSPSTSRVQIINLLDALQAAVDNIQGIAYGDDIPSTAILNSARAAIDRVTQYLNEQAFAPPSNGFDAGLRAARQVRVPLLNSKDHSYEWVSGFDAGVVAKTEAIHAIQSHHSNDIGCGQSVIEPWQDPPPASLVEESVSVEELADFIFDNECDMYSDTARAILAMFDIKKRSGI